MGVKVKDKKTLFQFGADGKLQEVKINPIVPEEDTPNDKTSDNDAKKFGSNLNTKMGGGGGAKPWDEMPVGGGGGGGPKPWDEQPVGGGAGGPKPWDEMPVGGGGGP